MLIGLFWFGTKKEMEQNLWRKDDNLQISTDSNILTLKFTCE